MYQPNKDNIIADTISRTHCGVAINKEKLSDFHFCLCHPGITRLAHFRIRNFSYSIECPVCAWLKPWFYIPRTSHLIKATQPMERINMNFKRSFCPWELLLTIDEYFCFLFAFPCPNLTMETIIWCLNLCSESLHTFILIGTFISVKGAARVPDKIRNWG